jgi:hypothetical protein
MSDDDGQVNNQIEAVVVVNKRKVSDYSDSFRKQVISFIIDNSVVDGDERDLIRGTYASAAKFFAEKGFTINETTIRRMWLRAKENKRLKGAYTASPTKKGRCGRPRKWNREELKREMEKLPRAKRSTFRDLSLHLGVPRSTLALLLHNENVIRRQTCRVKPSLTEYNQLVRFYYASHRIRIIDYEMKFDGEYNEVHLDEKWFFLTQKDRTYYLTEDEEDVTRRVRHQSHIPKVMFLCAVARPRFDRNGVCTFDGKIGLWPFLEDYLTVRPSANRPAGHWEERPINVSKQVYLEYFLTKVLPAIKEKWPRNHNPGVINVGLQHDNAPVHFAKTEPAFVAAAHPANNDERWQFHLKEQPANSPDTNILDLGFFNSLQSIHWKHCEEEPNINGLIESVTRAFDEYDPVVLNRVFITHQTCLDEIIKVKGDNNYKIPHVQKEMKERNNNDYIQTVDVSVDAINSLHEEGLYDEYFEDLPHDGNVQMVDERQFY